MPNDGVATYRNAKAHFTAILEENGGSYPLIPPVEVSADRAHCKQVIRRLDDIDLTTFAFIQSNPGDAGRYINTGSVFTKDPEMGMNFGTYRCQLRGPREIGINPEPRQTGYRMLMAAREPAALADAVQRLLARPPARAATRRYAEGFDWRATTTGQIELFADLLARPRRATAPPVRQIVH